MPNRRLRSLIFLGLTCVLISGCGGGATGSVSGGGSTSAAPVGVTAQFKVDLNTGQVQIINGTASSRSVYSGDAVQFTSTTVVDVPGDPGYKQISVSIKNNSGLTIGQGPSGEPTGLKVVLGPISNLGTGPDPRASALVSDFAGTGSVGDSVGQPQQASLSGPSGVAVAPDGTAYIADTGNYKIKKVSRGVLTSVAGGGIAGSVDGFGAAARVNSVRGMAIDPFDGAVIICDSAANRILRLAPDGYLSSIAGTGASGLANGAGNVSTFSSPLGVYAGGPGQIFVTDTSNAVIRMLTCNSAFTGTARRAATRWVVTTFSGSGTPAITDGTATTAQFQAPIGICKGPNGGLLVSEGLNSCLRYVDPAGNVFSITTPGTGYTDGDGTVAKFNNIQGLVGDGKSVYITDNANRVIRQGTLVAPNDPTKKPNWVFSTLAGQPSVSGHSNGAGTAALLGTPAGIALDANGSLLFTDLNYVRKVVPVSGNFATGVPTGSTSTEPITMATPSGTVPFTDGTFVPQVRPYMSYPGSLASGATSAAKAWNFIVPKGVTAFQFSVTVEAQMSGYAELNSAVNVGSDRVMVTTYAGANNSTGPLDGPLAIARFSGLYFGGMSNSGDLYVTDAYASNIRRVAPDGMVSTIAGAKSGSFADGPGSIATFSGPEGIAVSPDGQKILVCDYSNHRIRVLVHGAGDPSDASTWTVGTVAGTGTSGFRDGVGTTAQVASPSGIVQAGPTVWYFAEYGGNRVRRLQFTGGDPLSAANYTVTRLAGSTTGATGSSDGSNSVATFNAPGGLTLDAVGNVLVADYGNNLIRRVSSLGDVTTIAGTVGPGYADSTNPLTAKFSSPWGIVTDPAGYIYVSEFYPGRVRRIAPNGTVTTVAGSSGNSADGPGNTAKIFWAAGVVLNNSGDMFLLDASNIRRIQNVVSSAP